MEELKRSLKEKPQGDTPGALLEAELLKHVKYKILSAEGDRVKLKIDAPDMSLLMANGGDALFLREDGLTEAARLLKKKQYQTITFTLTVELDEQGIPIDPFPLYDALYGGLLSAMDEMLENGGGKG